MAMTPIRVALFGATSAIAEACARRYAQRGARLCLIGRDRERLESIAADLRIRGANEVVVRIADLADVAALPDLVEQAWAHWQGVDLALLAHGSLPEQARCEREPDYALQQFHLNASAPIALLLELAPRFEAQGCGTLAAIGSVAGDRGRASNGLYGSAKAAIETALSALRQRLLRCGVTVLLIKPGWVDTPMTADFRKGPLWVGPEHVAADILAAVDRRWRVIYTPWFWWPIAALIRALPEFVFQRLRF
jgi:short-subunit dehydrogenase